MAAHNLLPVRHVSHGFAHSGRFKVHLRTVICRPNQNREPSTASETSECSRGRGVSGQVGQNQSSQTHRVNAFEDQGDEPCAIFTSAKEITIVGCCACEK